MLSVKYNKANRSCYFMFCLLIKGKIFEIGLNKNYDFLKISHKEPSQNLSGHAAG